MSYGSDEGYNKRVVSVQKGEIGKRGMGGIKDVQVLGSKYARECAMERATGDGTGGSLRG